MTNIYDDARTDADPMKPEIKAQWLAALRSGQYTQATGVLHETGPRGDSYCCLGVLCDLAEKAGVVESDVTQNPRLAHDNTSLLFEYRPAGFDKDPRGDDVGYDEISSGTLPDAVQEWAGITDSAGVFNKTPGGPVDNWSTLADENDGGASFEEIAELIEQHF